MSDEVNAAAESEPVDEGPGCMPAILAGTALMGIVGFVFCGFMTWLIFQKQDELALRAVKGNLIPAIEQSYLEPDEKKATVEHLQEFADQLERKQVEGWQASGVMQRLSRLPLLQWGHLRRIEAFIDEHPDDFEDDATVQFARLRKGVERNDVTTIDFLHILSPVLEPSGNQQEAPLVDPLEIAAVADVVQRARLVADRSEVDAEPKNDVGIDVLVRRQIEAGLEQGTY